MKKYHEIDRLHQIIILDDNRVPDRLPPLIQQNINCLRQLYPDAAYKLWSGDDLHLFLEEHFEPEVLAAYETLTPYSYRCDLARFALLYVYGGLYVDLGLRFMSHWRIPKTHGIAAFRDVPFVSRSWSAMQTGVLWSKPGRPEWKQAIQWIVENCRTKYYGENALYPTGPILLGRAFIAAMAARGQSSEADDQRIGECRCLTPESEMLNVSYISREGSLVALRTKVIPGDISHLGVKGANNYNTLWRTRQAYGETERTWRFDDVLVKTEDIAVRTNRGIAPLPGAMGRVCYGPFVTLDEGDYLLTIRFSPQTTYSRLFVDIASDHGGTIVQESDVLAPPSGPDNSIQVDFHLARYSVNVEFRVQVFGDFKGEIVEFGVTRAKTRRWSYEDQALQLIDLERTPTGVPIPAGRTGRVLYGPYAQLDPGAYTLTVKLGAGTMLTRLMVDVVANRGSECLHVFDYSRAGNVDEQELAFTFTSDRTWSDVEFRMEVFGDFAGAFLGYELTALDPQDA